MRIATWNMRNGGRPEAWRYVEEQLCPDVALLQEANPRHRLHPGWAPIDERRRWGSLVVARDGLRASPVTAVKGSAMKSPVSGQALSQTYPGAVYVAQIQPAGSEPLIFVSVYVVQEDNVAQTVVHRVLSDLFPLLTDVRYKDRIVLGGDLNVSTQLGGMWARHSKSALDRITSAYGLINLTDGLRQREARLRGCPCRDEVCGHVRTRRSSNSPVPWQTDYLFVSAKLKKRVAHVEIPGDDDAAYAFSDHAPLIAHLQL